MERKVTEAIEQIDKDLYTNIPEAKPEDIKLQAVAPVSYVAAVNQSKKEKEKFEKMIDDKVTSAQGLNNKDEDRFKHMSIETGKSTLNIDQPGLKKMHLDESLFEFLKEDELLDESKDKIKFNENDEEKLNSLAKKYNINIVAYKDLIHFQVEGEISNIKEFEKAYLKEFEEELRIYGDTEYLGENLNEGVQDDDGWNWDEINDLSSADVLNKIESLIYELKEARRGVYTGAKTAEELANYISSLSDELQSFSEEIEELGDSEDFDESLNESRPNKNPKYKGYIIRLENKGGINAYNIYDKHGELEDTGFKSIEDAKKAIDDLSESLNESKNINESKKFFKEALIISDVKTFRPWNKAVSTYNKIKEEDKLEDLEKMIEEMYPDGIEAQTLNDLLTYDIDFLNSMMDIDFEEKVED